MSETRMTTRGRRREVSLTPCPQNWSHNLPEDHGKIYLLFYGAICVPTVKSDIPMDKFSVPTVAYDL